MLINTFLTTLAFVATTSAAPVESSPLTKRIADAYHPYTGDGSIAAGWPAQKAWGTFDALWNANVPLMQKSCGWNGWGADNSAAEIAGIKAAIGQAASQTGVDNRFILAIIMQESKGCVRVPTTNNGVVNPGLMQSHNGSGTCAGVNPCPNAKITKMVMDGTAGTASGDGLKQTFGTTSAKLGGKGPRSYYSAARLYNSGSVDYTNLNNAFTSTHCYAQDVANRLTGWTLAASNCAA